MTSIRLKFRPSKVYGKPGTLYFRLIHNRIVRQIGMSCKLYPHEWQDGQLKLCEQGEERFGYLAEVRDYLQAGMLRLQSIIRNFEQKGMHYTVEQVVSAYKSRDNDTMKLCVFVDEVARHLKNIGKIRLAETYTVSANSFMRFRGEKGDIRLDEINAELMKEYEYYLLEECGLGLNTISFYMRNLRAIYNRAVDKELIESQNPFKHVYTGIGKTTKRAVSIDIIHKIKLLDLSMYPLMEQSRDYFMLSFYLRGISFVDLAYLKVDNLHDGNLKYYRQKTNQPLCIRWEEQMQEIVNRYHVPGSPYLLPIINPPCENERRQYQSGLHRVNAHLKVIGQLVGCPIKLTTYCARHGWASIARSMNVPLPVISESMGHESESTTRIYLASLDNAVIDEANKMVINAI